MNRIINTTVGIYETAYVANFHRNGDVTVSVPYVKWSGSTGSLAFKKIRTTGKDANYIRNCFADNDASGLSEKMYVIINR